MLTFLTYRDESVENGDSNPNSGTKFTEDVVSIDLWCSLTLMYLFVEVGRLAGDTPDAQLLQHELCKNRCRFFMYNTDMTSFNSI